MRLGLWWCVSLCLLSACKSPREKHEAKAREVIAALPGFAGPAKAAPEASEQTAAPLKNLSDLTVRYQHATAMLVHLEELENPTLRKTLPVRVNQRSPTVDAANALGLVKAEPSATLDTSYDPACPDDSVDWLTLGNLKYLLVVRSNQMKAARMTGEKTFEGGGWTGEVLVFDVESKALLGSFALVGSHHAVVGTRLGRDEQNLAADRALATRGNFNAELRKRIPSVGEHDEIN